MTDLRLGLLGGTFDPIHVGHLDVAVAAERALDLTRVVVIPSHVPPHRSGTVASSYHRFAMAALAVGGHPRWQVSDTELLHVGPSYTADTLRRYHASGVAPSSLFFLLGADAFADIALWREYPAVLDLAHFVVVSRPGRPVTDLPAHMPALADRMVDAWSFAGSATTAQPVARRPAHATSIILVDAATRAVSSTAVRAALAAGQEVAADVPEAVRHHIAQHQLYTSHASAPGAAAATTSSPAGRLHGQD